MLCVCKDVQALKRDSDKKSVTETNKTLLRQNGL